MPLLGFGGGGAGEALLDTLVAEDILEYQDLLIHQLRMNIRADGLDTCLSSVFGCHLQRFSKQHTAVEYTIRITSTV